MYIRFHITAQASGISLLIPGRGAIQVYVPAFIVASQKHARKGRRRWVVRAGGLRTYLPRSAWASDSGRPQGGRDSTDTLSVLAAHYVSYSAIEGKAKEGLGYGLGNVRDTSYVPLDSLAGSPSYSSLLAYRGEGRGHRENTQWHRYVLP